MDFITYIWPNHRITVSVRFLAMMYEAINCRLNDNELEVAFSQLFAPGVFGTRWKLLPKHWHPFPGGYTWLIFLALFFPCEQWCYQDTIDKKTWHTFCKISNEANGKINDDVPAIAALLFSKLICQCRNIEILQWIFSWNITRSD